MIAICQLASANAVPLVTGHIRPMQDEKLTEFLKGVVGVVEATSLEKLKIWEEYHKRVTWKEDPRGYLETVGHLHNRPICISLFTDTVDGQKLLFWHATSQLVDHAMIDQWFKDNMPLSAYRENGGVYINKVDAMNFHNVFRS